MPKIDRALAATLLAVRQLPAKPLIDWPAVDAVGLKCPCRSCMSPLTEDRNHASAISAQAEQCSLFPEADGADASA